MSEYNIQMNRYNALNAEYDQLYPATKIENVDGLDTTLQNKAVFGLCEGIYNFNSKSELEAKISELFNGMTDGSVRYWRFNMLAVFEPFGGGVWMLELIRLSENRCIARMSESSGKVLVLRKDASWGAWEWLNPFMELGKEYRTTERYLGKPVYVKVVNAGKPPNASVKSVSYQTNGVVNDVISCTGCVSDGNGLKVTFPGGHFSSAPGTNDGLMYAYAASNGYFYIMTYADLTTWGDAYVTVKYTKIAE